MNLTSLLRTNNLQDRIFLIKTAAESGQGRLSGLKVSDRAIIGFSFYLVPKTV